MFKGFSARVKYLLWYFLTTNPVFPFIFLLSLSILAIVIAIAAYSIGIFSSNGLSGYGIDEEVDGYIGTIVWAFSHLLDTGIFTENLSAPPALLAFAAVNSVFGLVITSALIGNIVSAMQKGLDDMKSGGIAVHEVDHLIILGWSRNAIHILKVFAELGFRKRVVIMTPCDLEIVRKQLHQAKSRLRGLKPLLLHGQITSADDMARLSAPQSAHIVLLADDSLGKGTSQDAATIKAILQLKAMMPRETKTSFAVELSSMSNLKIARMASSNQYPTLASTEFVSKALVQAARYVGYGEVYRELYSLKNNRFEIFVPPGLADGALFGDVAVGFENAVAIGLTWLNDEGRRVALLNPEPEFDLAEGDELIVLVNGGQSVKYRPGGQALSASVVVERKEKDVLTKVLILGWNEHVADTVREFEAHAVQDLSITIACTVDGDWVANEVEQSLLRGRRTLTLSTCLYKENDPNAIADLSPQDFDLILQMADQTNPAFDADARSAVNMILLGEVAKHNPSIFPPVIAEFLEEDNRQLCIGTPLTDSIVTPQYISMQLAHLVNEPILESIFRELLNAGGVEIAIRPLDAYGNSGSVSFQQLCATARDRNETALGVRLGGVAGVLTLNPAPDLQVDISSDNAVIVLAQQVYG